LGREKTTANKRLGKMAAEVTVRISLNPLTVSDNPYIARRLGINTVGLVSSTRNFVNYF